MWADLCRGIFGCQCDERLRDLAQQRDQAEDAYFAVSQSRDAAVSAMHHMQKAVTDEGVADIAKRATSEIADIYASSSNGVRARNVAVHAVIAAAVRKAARGASSWNEGTLAAKEYD